MHHASTIRLTALAAACLACSSVTAQEHDPTALDPVVVTATRTATTVDASLAAVEVIAGGGPDAEVAEVKVVTGRFFAEHLLPQVHGLSAPVKAGKADLFALSADRL